MITTHTIFKSTACDQSLIARLPQAEGSFDYTYIDKPWGFEYLLFSNSEIAVWILFIQGNQQTSMHAHPNKTTYLQVLDGKAICSGLVHGRELSSGEGVLIEKGAFHQTTSFSEGVFIVEVETPVDKQDIVRFEDDYGRE